jgi:DNA-binding NtrC family response regulator
VDTVLVIDDEPSIRELWARILADAGYGVKSASTAVEAARLLTEAPTAVAICDVHLAGASGLWLAELIRREYPNTAIVLATGDAALPPRETLRPAVVAYVIKPVSRQDLLAAVETGIAWSVRQQARASGSWDDFGAERN